MLKIHQLTKKIQNRTLLNNVNLELDQGTIGILLGKSGVGKSTLLRVLNNLEDYNSGSFLLDGTALNLKTINQSHTIGMVFQHFNLFEHLNVQDNIVVTLTQCKGMAPQEAKNIAYKLLERYGLQQHSKSSVHHLSGGQKQRLAIARTLALDPKIICLDEPTSALDPHLTKQVAQYIQELANEKRMVLLTTHDMHLLKLLDGHLFFMEEGTIVEHTSKKRWSSNPENTPKLSRFLSHASD